MTAQGTQRSGARDAVVVRRCRDAGVIEEILARDYFDAPIPEFPASLRRTAARELFAVSDGVYFMIAEVAGRYAGFVFGHTLGQTLWRQFARRQLRKHSLALVWVLFRLKVIRPAWRRLVSLTRGVVQSRARPDGGRAGGLDAPRLGRPFAWSPQSPDVGHVDLLFVNDSFRGQGLAARLLEAAAGEMARDGVVLIEAHIDEHNYPSARAFLKAGWDVSQTTANDFYACYHPCRERAEAP